MTRRRFRRSAAWALSWLAGTCACAERSATSAAPATPPASTTMIVSIVATTDLHGHVEALPWLAGHLRALREARARDGGAVLLVDAGDMFQGTLESNLSEGAAVVAAYNAIGYAAAAIGNHEFDFGPEGPGAAPRSPADNARGAIEARAREARFPLLAANVRVSGNRPWSPPNIRPSAIVDAGGVKVGVIGVTTESTKRVTDPRNLVGLDFAPLAATIAAEAAALRAAGATVVIVAAHAGAACKAFDSPDDLSSCGGRQEIFDVARALPPGAVDAIAGGHTHQAVAHRVNGIPIVQAYAEGVAFGRVDLIVDRAAGRARESRIFAPRFVCAAAERHVIASAGPDACAPPSYEGRAVVFDASIANLLAPHRARAAAVRDRSLGVLVEAPFAQGARSESPLGNLVADLMRVVRPRADVAVYNWGGLRASVPSGPLTYGRLYRLIPFENAFASLEMTAADLGRAIVRSLERGFAHAFSGVRIEVRCDSGAPHPVVRRTSGEVVAPETRLTIAVPDFLAAGGDGLFEGLPARVAIETGPPIRDLLADALAARRGTISSSDLAIFDAARPRLTFPGTLPLRCSGDSFTPAR